MGCCKKNDDKGQCGVIARVFFYILGFIGIAFSLLTVFSCKFISYYTISGAVPSTLPSPFILSETANVGLFRWDNLDEDVENTGCVYYTDNEINNFDSAFRTAQIVGYVAVICAGLALLLSTIEFVCCRFCCSKFFLSFLMIFAMITQALTFAIYTTDNLCTAGRSCSMQSGGIFSIVATFFYFVESIIVCTTPKPTPWIKRIKDDDDDTGCLACCKKKKEPVEAAEAGEAKAVPPEATNDAAVAAATGAAVGAGTAAAVAAADNNEEEEKKPEGDEDAEAAPAAASDDDDVPADYAPKEGDEETGDAGADNAEEDAVSEVPSVTPSEPSQQGEEITIELSQSMKEASGGEQ